jgi:EAL domain-containing protein (putative c-di-GMP-specific phosphodiesterase class I)
MYQAKNTRNSHAVFSGDLREQIMETTYIQQALRQAVDREQFSLVYQPQVEHTGKPVGVEALLRWRDPERGNISPARFIPIAEDTGAILEIGHFVLETALSDLRRINCSGHCAELGLSVNVSIRQLEEAGFCASLAQYLERSGFAPGRLTLEITESIFIEDLRHMIPILHEIRELGVRLSLDDFGTGYSSLSLLRKLPIDELKIDRAFVENIVTHREDRLMIMNIVDIARNLDIEVVAEGIETADQSSLLIDMGCRLQQGFYFCRPAPLEQFVDYCSELNSDQAVDSPRAVQGSSK